MHYIRLLRSPVVGRGRVHASIKVVLTITTDLGDSFLSPREPLELSVIGAYTERRDGNDQLIPIELAQGCALRWRAGMRVLKFDVPLPPQPVATIQIRPSNGALAALSTTDISRSKHGLVIAAYANISRPSDAATAPVSFRSLRLPVSQDTAAQVMQVEEDIGESIARHIWDAGITAVSLIADICLDNRPEGLETTLPLLRNILRPEHHRPLNILELGCGVGILSIGMARILSTGQDGTTVNILMTDLPEAEERARANIARQAEGLRAAATTLDFEPLNWEDGKHGVFGKKAKSYAWDLIVLSDCTYNVDMLQPLIRTLSALYSHSFGHGSCAGVPVKTDVFLATKQRHSSEKVLFDLMSSDGWVVREQTVLRLPVLNGEGQSVELYLFGKE
ncbi:Putative methyltransferase-domain-containing protein [Madurella fahalii]|uniref:Methyltransferase-domain-containing protein n=1 Tax=Madurella fahalii TaxID=1157608 RepID=A0ABQ0GE96_9PEZI